jgi:hypothetical protein
MVRCGMGVPRSLQTTLADGSRIMLFNWTYERCTKTYRHLSFFDSVDWDASSEATGSLFRALESGVVTGDTITLAWIL